MMRLFPAWLQPFGLRLMAQHKEVHVEQLGHAIQSRLAVPAPPRQQVRGTRLFTVAEPQFPLEDARIELVDATIVRQGVGNPHPVAALDGQRLREEELPDGEPDVRTGRAELPLQGQRHGPVHLLAVFHHLAAVDGGRIVVSHHEMDLVRKTQLVPDRVEQQLVG